MPNHKFRYTDLEVLEQNPLTGNYHLLIVGTFNADIPDNEAVWFYGRPENEFWCLLPRMMNDPTLHPIDRNEPLVELSQVWRNYCREKRIIIVDIFKEVFPEIHGHGDNELDHLQEHEFIAFNFQQAFANASFDAVLFTWKGMTNNTLTAIKQQYIAHFQPTGSGIFHMVSPGNKYSKSRHYKLTKWKEEYEVLLA